MAIDISQLGFFQKIKVLLHTGEGKPGINHMKYWIPVLIKSGVEFAVLTRNETVFKELSKEFKRGTILFATTPLEVEEVVNNLPKLKTILYTSNTGNNIHLLRFIDYEHIYIGSEYSDRDSAVTKFTRAYDQLWVSSDAVKDKFSKEIDISTLKFLKIGKPQLKSLLTDSREKQKDSILYLISNEGDSELNNFSSLRELGYIFNELGKKGFKFDFVLDKKIGSRDKRYKKLKEEIEEASYTQHIDVKFYDELTEDLLIKSKYIICDIKKFNHNVLASGATGAVIFLYIPHDKIIENYTLNKYMSYDMVHTFSSVEELAYKMGLDTKELQIDKNKIDYWLGVNETLNDVFYGQLKTLTSKERAKDENCILKK